MLKLYTNINFLTETHRKTVFPLLFDLHFLKNNDLSNYYRLVEDIQKCDIVVFPIDYVKFLKFKDPFSQLLKQSKTHKKPIWIYTAGDYGFTNYLKNSYTFRLGGFNSRLNSNSFVIPSFINDPYSQYLNKGFSVLKKEVHPTIGFVGHAQTDIKKYIKEILNHFKYRAKIMFKLLLADKQSFYPSSIKRAYYLNKLQNSKNLRTDFILRMHYRAGAINELDKHQSAQEFYENIFNNAYTFCMRGVGNFSVRFYETLAVGRIPVLLDTDCRLPLSDMIDWTKHCLILDSNHKMTLEKQIVDFHNHLSADAFVALQQSNRNLWFNQLRRDAYFIVIQNQFKNKFD